MPKLVIHDDTWYAALFKKRYGIYPRPAHLEMFKKHYNTHITIEEFFSIRRKLGRGRDSFVALVQYEEV